jgi:ribonuclease J
MTLTIHRGAAQIGGCVTEIRTQNTRVFIDFGTQLPNLDGTTPQEHLSIPGLTGGTVDCDAVFFSHGHGDHMGNLHRILPGISIYMGPATREINLCLHQRLQKAHDKGADLPDQQPTLDALERAKTFVPAHPISVGDLTATPFRVDHSGFDAYCFLIEGDGVRVLHTGDFRNHGFTGKGLEPTLERYVGQVDWLIMEGTMLSRTGETVLTERELSLQAAQILRKHPHVFVLCSSTNIDRLASFHSAARKERVHVFCDGFQKDILTIAQKYDRSAGELYTFRDVHPFPKEGLPNRFLAFVRDNARCRQLMEPWQGNCLVLYSMWSGYLEKPSVQSFLEGFSYQQLHTSGHATPETLRKVCALTAPRRGVIPIHTEHPELFQKVLPDAKVVPLPDGQSMDLACSPAIIYRFPNGSNSLG